MKFIVVGCVNSVVIAVIFLYFCINFPECRHAGRPCSTGFLSNLEVTDIYRENLLVKIWRFFL